MRILLSETFFSHNDCGFLMITVKKSTLEAFGQEVFLRDPQHAFVVKYRTQAPIGTVIVYRS